MVALHKRRSMDRKKIIKEYKNTPRPMGIFQIRNKANGKVLIGSSVNLPGALNRFRAELKLGSCRNMLLQREWEVFGPESFEFSELELLEPPAGQPDYDPAEDLRVLESLWFEELSPFGENGYNKPPKAAS